MADNDEFRRQIAPCWRKPYDAAKSDASPFEVAALCAPTAAQFFQQHGCPQFEEFCQIIKPGCASGGQIPLLTSFDFHEAEARCRQLAASCAGQENAAVAEYTARAIGALLLRAQTCGHLDGKASELLAHELCIGVTTGVFLDRLAQSKVLERFRVEAGGDVSDGADALFEWMAEAETHLRQELRVVARKLSADPSGQTVKVRAKRIPKRSTAEHMALRLA